MTLRAIGLTAIVFLGALVVAAWLFDALISTPKGPATPASAFLSRFMTDDGRVIDTGNGDISHSEGQGYGLLLAEAAGDRRAFNRLWTWTDTHLAVRDDALIAWRFDPESGGVVDANNATDGDILIAWALLRAYDRWGRTAHKRRALRILGDIESRLIRETAFGPVLSPGAEGFETDAGLVVNLSYWVFPAFQRFEAERGEIWRDIQNSGLALALAAGEGRYGLVSDWTLIANDGALRPAGGWPPEFGYNAVRVPLHACWVRYTGDAEADRQALIARYRAFWRAEGDPIIDRWNVATDTADGAPAPPGFEAVAALADNACAAPTDTLDAPDDAYYSAALRALAQLAGEDAAR